MLQKTYHIEDYTPDKLRCVLREAAASDAYRGAGQVLLTVFEQSWDPAGIGEKIALAEEYVPRAELVGVTHYDSMEEAEHPRNNSIFTFFYFDSPAFTLCRVPLPGLSDAALGRRLRDALSAEENLRCVMTLFPVCDRDIEEILRSASEGLGDFPMFGSTAGEKNVFRGDYDGDYVFDREGVYTDALLAVVFHGAELRVRASFQFGWIPVGKPMTVTSIADRYTVREIDGAPAAEVFQKYLGLPGCTEEPLNIQNICEFPLTVERRGLRMARIPSGWDRDGSLLFHIPVRMGERLRLSYGLPQQLFAQIAEDTEALRAFGPQGMFLVVCMNRMIFLHEKEQLEIDAYRALAPDVAFLHGNSEIYWNHGTGGEMHSALIAVAFREGPAEPAARPAPSPAVPALRSSQIIPLENRLATFLRAVTRDLEKATVELLRLQRNLENEVRQKTKENEALSLHVVQTLAEAIDAKDPYTKGHSGRVAEYSREIARRAGFDENAQRDIYVMGLLHDVGKIGIPDAVINKTERLTDEEYAAIKTHPETGARILKAIREMPKLMTGARWHHERFDGKGYPDGLKGYAIPEEARIICVADAYDAMTSNRSYRGAMPQARVREQIARGMGTQFDPRFGEIMLQMIDEDTDYRLHE